MPDRVITTAASGPSVTGLTALPTDSLLDVARALWFEFGPMRGAIHRLRRVGRCDLRVVVAGVPFGDVRPGPGDAPGTRLCIRGECLCRDYLVDLFAEADRFLADHGAELRNPPGAVRAHLQRREPAAWTRRRRTEMGAQARPERVRDSARGRALPDEFHRALFEYVVDEAGSLAPLEDDAQLHRRLAELAAAEFGGAAADYAERVVAGLGVVEAACRSGRRVGVPGERGVTVTWWERYVEWPLGRRARLGDVPIEEAVVLAEAAWPIGSRLEPMSLAG